MRKHPLVESELADGQIRLHWFGQSSFALKDCDGTIVQVDPYFPLWRPSSEFIHVKAPLDEATLPSDAILVTHDHRDHNCPESQQRFLQANSRTRFFGTRECVTRLRDSRISPELSTAVTAGESFRVGSMTVTTVYAKPPEGDAEQEIDAPDVEHLGFVIEAGAQRVWFTGDPIHNLDRRKDLLDPIRGLQPTVAVLTTHPTEGEFPFFEGSWAAASYVGAGVAVPSHYDCFVKRTYDPREWAAGARAGIKPLIIAYNTSVVL